MEGRCRWTMAGANGEQGGATRPYLNVSRSALSFSPDLNFSGKLGAQLLLEEITRGGVIDTQSQAPCLLLMALGPEDVSKVRFGKLSPFTIQFLRDLKTFFGVTFKLQPDPEDQTTV